MSKKKYYAVKNGKVPGIYDSWTDCQKNINGYSRAVYKSFKTKEEAEEYLEGAEQDDNTTTTNFDGSKNYAVAYTDGSYDVAENRFSYGVVLFCHNKRVYLSERFENSELATMRNVAGEIEGAKAAMRYCFEHEIDQLILFHDYEGISKWCTKEWIAKKNGTIEYVNYYDYISEKVKVIFKKVKSHSGDKYNEIADKLAKQVLGI